MQPRSGVRHSVRPSVSLVGILTVTYQGAACDAVSVHFGPTIRRTDRGLFVLPAKARRYVFTGVGLCVCVWLSACDHDN